MTLVKIVKNKPYFKRFQVKYRRRREGKTDYQARRRLIWQDKNKYATDKYRFVVRFTNRDIICQIVNAKIIGDEVFCCAYSHELPRYGLKVGLTNYAAAYATALLCSRRALQKLGMDQIYEGVSEPNGEMASMEIHDERRPFTAYLDIGLKRSTTGAKVFGALKGAVDGGINIPHNEKRFPGYKDNEYNPEVHRNRIMGNTNTEFMRELEENDEAVFQKTFSKFIAEDVTCENYEELVEECLQKIKEDPSPKESKKEYTGPKIKLTKKMNLKQRKDRVKQVKESYLQKLREENE